MVLTLFVALFSWKRQLLLKTGTQKRFSEGHQIKQKNRLWRCRKTSGRTWGGAVQTQGWEVIKGTKLVQVTLTRKVCLQSSDFFKIFSVYVTWRWIRFSTFWILGSITAEVRTSDDHAAEIRRKRQSLAQGQGRSTVITAEVVVRAGWFKVFYLAGCREHLVHWICYCCLLCLQRPQEANWENTQKKS